MIHPEIGKRFINYQTVQCTITQTEQNPLTFLMLLKKRWPQISDSLDVLLCENSPWRKYQHPTIRKIDMDVLILLGQRHMMAEVSGFDEKNGQKSAATFDLGTRRTLLGRSAVTTVPKPSSPVVGVKTS